MQTEVSEDVVQHNATLILKYISEEKRGLSDSRKKNIRLTLTRVGRDFIKKPLDEVSKDDLELFLKDLRDDELSVEYSDSTKITTRKILKMFYRWLHDEEWVEWLKTGSFSATFSPEDILSPDERSRLEHMASIFPRDHAMFSSLYESAVRPKEFMALWKHDISFEQGGPATMHIEKGKGGKSRDIMLFQDANPLLHKWIFNEHPLRTEKDFPLWVEMSRNSDHDALNTGGLRKFMERITDAAHMTKRVVPYTLRHTRLTDLARDGATEALLSDIAGWTLGSKMPAVYIHLSKRDMRPMMEKLLGISRPVTEIERRLPKLCQNCSTANMFESRVCSSCGMALDAKTAVEMTINKNNQISGLREEMRNIVTDFRSEMDELKKRLDRQQ